MLKFLPNFSHYGEHSATGATRCSDWDIIIRHFGAEDWTFDSNLTRCTAIIATDGASD